MVADGGGYGPRRSQAATVTDSDGYTEWHYGKQTEAGAGQLWRLRETERGGYGTAAVTRQRRLRTATVTDSGDDGK